LKETGRFLLRESAQCPAKDREVFQDIERHRYFNTNNLWIDLPALHSILSRGKGYLELPLIRNSKTVDPKNPSSTPVFQLETAMGAAISIFENSQALSVPRNRFAPVKTTDDLLAIRSNATSLSEDFLIVPKRKREMPVVRLDPQYYKMIDDLEKRFPYGPPSLINCDRFEVEGDCSFGRNVVVRGNTKVSNQGEKSVRIENDKILEGNYLFQD
jgi:UTP--glucose-1-phosphate uridylyltransferase